MRLLVVISLCVTSATALSCLACTKEQEQQCEVLSCENGEKGVMPDPCFGCCPKCGKKIGRECTESEPCKPGLYCFKTDFDPEDPWIYDGVCILDHKDFPSAGQKHNSLP